MSHFKRTVSGLSLSIILVFVLAFSTAAQQEGVNGEKAGLTGHVAAAEQARERGMKGESVEEAGERQEEAREREEEARERQEEAREREEEAREEAGERQDEALEKKDKVRQREDAAGETPRGLKKQREKKMEQERTESGKGSEQGQEKREERSRKCGSSGNKSVTTMKVVSRLQHREHTQPQPFSGGLRLFFLCGRGHAGS